MHDTRTQGYCLQFVVRYSPLPQSPAHPLKKRIPTSNPSETNSQYSVFHGIIQNKSGKTPIRIFTDIGTYLSTNFKILTLKTGNQVLETGHRIPVSQLHFPSPSGSELDHFSGSQGMHFCIGIVLTYAGSDAAVKKLP
jgi:hypothetical protein